MLQYIDRNQKFGLSAVFYIDNSRLPMLTVRNETGSAYYRNNYIRATMSKYLGMNHLMDLSISLENSSFSPDFISLNQLLKISYRSLSESFSYRINTLDTKHFPNKGLLFQISVNTSRLLSGKIQTDNNKEIYTPEFPDDFLFKRSFSVAGDIRRYFSPDRKLTLAAGCDILFSHTKDSVTSPHNYFFAGGQESVFSRSIPLTGFHPGEIAVERYAALRFDADFEFHKDLHLNLLTNIALARESGQDEDFSVLGGYGLGVGYMSLIGPMKVGLMHGLSSSKRYFNAIKGYVSIGFRF